MIKSDNSTKKCFISCDEQTIKDKRCSCRNISTSQDLLDKTCSRVNNLENNRCINCGAKAGHNCELNVNKNNNVI